MGSDQSCHGVLSYSKLPDFYLKVIISSLVIVTLIFTSVEAKEISYSLPFTLPEGHIL